MEEIEILKFIMTMDSTNLIKGLSSGEKAFEGIMDVFDDFNGALETNKSSLVESMKQYNAVKVILGKLQERVKQVNDEFGKPIDDAAIDGFVNHLEKAVKATVKESHKLQKQFAALENIKPKIEFDIEGLKKVGAETSDIIALKDKLYSKEYKTTDELKQQKQALMQLITIRKSEAQEQNAHASAYRKAKMEQIEMVKRLHDIEGKAYKEGVTSQIQPALNKVKDSYLNFFKDIDSYSSKQINEMMNHLKTGISGIEKEISRTAKANKEAFGREQMASSSSSESRKYTALSDRVKPEIMSGKKGMKNQAAVYLEMDLKNLALKFQLLRKEMELGIRPAADLEREFKRLQAEGKHLNDVFKEQKAVVKQATDAFQNKRKELYDIANIGESMMMQAGMIGGAFALTIKEFTSAFLQFEEVYNRLRGVSFSGDIEALNRDSQAFKDTAQEVAGKTSFMAYEITQAGVAMVKVGFTLDQTTQSIEAVAQAAEASGESMETVAEITAGVINSFGLSVNDTQMIIDTLTRGAIESAADIKSLGETLKYVGPIALATSESYTNAAEAFSETAAMATFLGKNMVLGSQAGTTLRQMLIRLTDVTPEARKVMDALNVSFTSSNGKMKKQSEFLIELSHALDNVTPSMRNMALATIFGERAITGTSAALNQIAKDEDAFRKTIQNFSKDAAGMTKMQQEISFTGLTAEIKKFLASFDAFKVSLGESFSTIAKPAIAILRGAIDVFNNMNPALKQVTVWLNLIGAGFFGMIAIGGTLLKMYASWNQAILFLTNSNILLKSKIDATTSSIAAQTVQINANTQASNLNAGATGGMMLKVGGAIGKFGAWGLAISSVITLLISLYNWMSGNSDALESNNQAIASQIELDLRRKQLKKDVVDILKKERENVKLLTEDYEKLTSGYKNSINEAERNKKKTLDQINALNKLADVATDKKWIRNVLGGNIDIYEGTRKFKIKTELEANLSPEQLKFIKDNYQDLLDELFAGATDDLDMKIRGFADPLMNYVDSLNKFIEKASPKLEQASSSLDISKKVDKANEELEKQAKLLDQLYALENNLESEKEKEKIKQRITKETKEYIRLAIIVEELSGKAGRNEAEILEAVNKKYETQKRLYDLQEKGKNSEKAKLELLIKQNDERQKEIDLLAEVEKLKAEKAYAKSIGAEVYDTSGKSSGVDIDSVINSFAQEVEKEKQERDRNQLKSVGSTIVEAKTASIDAPIFDKSGSASTGIIGDLTSEINDLIKELKETNANYYNVDNGIIKLSQLLNTRYEKYGYKPKKNEINHKYLNSEESALVRELLNLREDKKRSLIQMSASDLDKILVNYTNSLANKYGFKKDSIPVSAISKQELDVLQNMIDLSNFKHETDDYLKELKDFVTIDKDIDEINNALHYYLDTLKNKYAINKPLNGEDISKIFSKKEFSDLIQMQDVRDKKAFIQEFLPNQLEYSQRIRDENLDVINFRKALTDLSNADQTISKLEAKIQELSSKPKTDENLESLKEVKKQYDSIKSYRINAEREVNSFSIKQREQQIKRERERIKHEKKAIVENFQLDSKLSQLLTASKLDDFDYELKEKLTALEQQKEEEKRAFTDLHLGISDEEFYEKALDFTERFNKKREIIEKEHAYKVYEYKRELEEKLFSAYVDNEQKRLALIGAENNPKFIGMSIGLKYAVEELKLENDIKNESNKLTEEEVNALKEKLDLIKQIKNNEIISATFEAEMKNIENLKTYISLSQEKDYLLQDILAVTNMISNVEKEIATQGLVDSVQQFQKLGEVFKSINTEELINATNSALGEQNDLLNKQIDLIDEADLSKLNDEEFNALLKRRNELETQLNNNIKTQNLLTSESYVNWRKMTDELARLRNAYDPLNNAAKEFASVLKDTPFSGFADAIAGSSDLGSKIFDLAAKANDIAGAYAKVQESAGGNAGSKIGALFNGGSAKAISSAAPGFVPDPVLGAIIAMAPLALDIAKTIGTAMLDAFFPGSSRAAREFKRNISEELISARESIDKELLARGDISKSVFNERRLEAAAVSYENKLTKLEDDIWDKSMDALNRNAAGLIAAGVFESITPFGWLFGAFTDNAAEKQLKEDLAKIEEYSKLMQEKLKLEQEKMIRELTSEKTFGDILDLSKFLQSSFDTAVITARNFGGKKDEISAEFGKSMMDIANESLQAAFDYSVDLDLNKYNAKVAELAAKTTEAKRVNFEALNNLQAEEKTRDSNYLNRLAQVNSRLGEFAKQEIEIRTNLANSLIEIERKIAEARNRGDFETVQFLMKEKQLTEAEGADAVQRSADAARKAFVDFNNELAEAKAKMTSGGKDDALVALNTELGNIQDKAAELTRNFPQLADKIPDLQSVMIKSAFRTYNEAVLSEESELLGQERGILAKSFLLEGNDLEAAKQDMRNQAQELIDELENMKLLNAGDESEQTRRMIENKEKMTQQAIYEIALEGFRRVAELRQQDLDEYLEIQKLKAENAFDPYGVVSADTQSQMNAIAFEKYIAQQTIKNQEKLNNKLALLNEQEKKLRREGVENAASAAIDELNRIKDIREQILEDATKTYELDIKKNQREIDLMQREVDVLQRKKDQIQKDIDAQQREFNKLDKDKFQDFISGFSIPQEVMDALEYISNPLANKYGDASYISVLEGIQKESEIGKRTTEVAYALEDIDTQAYYEELKAISGNQAAVAKYALSLVEDQQKAELDRLRAKGATEGEIMLMEKRQIDEKLEILEFYAEAYEDYQNAELGLIEARYEKELELNDDLTQAKEDSIQDLQWANEDLQWKIDELSMAAQDDYDLIDEKVRKIEESTRNWGFTNEDVMTKLPELVANAGVKFDELRAKIEGMKGSLAENMPTVTGFEAQLAAQQANKFSDLMKSPADMDIGQWREQHYYGTEFANQTDEITFKPPSRSSMTTTDPEGWFTLQSPITNRWYRTNTEMANDEKLHAVGMAQGGMTRRDVGGAHDYINVKARGNELFAPIRNFESFAQELAHRAIIRNGYNQSKNELKLNMQFGNVYGVDDLIGTIDYAIKKSNKELGFFNAPYTSGNT